MHSRRRFSVWLTGGLALCTSLALACAPAAPAPTSASPKAAATSAPAPKADQAKPPAQPAAGKTTAAPTVAANAPLSKPAAKAAETESLDALYEKAKQEGDKVVLYSPLAQVNAQKILPLFEQRFPGIKVEHIDATSEKLVARVISEARGGKVLGDVFQSPLNFMAQVHEQGLLLDWVPTEAAAYDDSLKSSWWVTSDATFLIMAWNTTLVEKGEEPTTFDDVADSKWKGRLSADATDPEMLLAFAKHKFKSEEKAVDLIRRIAANNPEFHKGHSELAELLAAGQSALCWTCYSHHYPPRIKKGVPVGYALSEGVGLINGTSVFKDAPHPNLAKLYARWVTSEEGQRAYAEGGRTPTHPNVQPKEKTRPEKIYAISVDDYKDLPKYQQLWKDIFQLR